LTLPIKKKLNVLLLLTTAATHTEAKLSAAWSKICVANDRMTNCHADKLYELYAKDTGDVEFRCAKCNNNFDAIADDPDTVYYLNKAADYKCTKYKDATNKFRTLANGDVYYDGTTNKLPIAAGAN